MLVLFSYAQEFNVALEKLRETVYQIIINSPEYKEFLEILKNVDNCD